MTRHTSLFLITAILLLCTAIGLHFMAGYSQDKLWLLLAAHKWLNGEKLYVDIFEINPPLIIWLNAAPVYLSMHLGLLSDIHYTVILGLLLISGIIPLCLALIKYHPGFSSRKVQWSLGLLLASLFVTFQNPFYFAEREHIFLILTFPYILRFMPSVSAPPQRLRVLTGLLAGIGFCIKPHCFIVFAGIQLITILRERSFAILISAENILIYLVATTYLAAIYCFAPEYITVVFPMALATYSTVSKGLQGMTYLVLALFTLAIALADFRLRYTSPYRRDIFYLLGICLLMTIYGIVNNGWGYTWLPLHAMALTTAGWIWLEQHYLKTEHTKMALPLRPFILGERDCLTAFMLNTAMVLLYVSLFATSCGTLLECKSGKQFVKNTEMLNDNKPVTSFGTISLDFATWTYFNRSTGAMWKTRFNQLWMLPKFLLSDNRFTEKHKWVIDYTADALAQDMKNHKPEVMFVDNLDYLSPTHQRLDPLILLTISAPFMNEWKHYRYMGKINAPSDTENQKNSHIYYVYKRIE